MEELGKAVVHFTLHAAGKDVETAVAFANAIDAIDGLLSLRSEFTARDRDDCVALLTRLALRCGVIRGSGRGE
jgi:hypothetical protein